MSGNGVSLDKNPPVKLPNEPTITPQIVTEHGLSPEEYQRVLAIIDRLEGGRDRDEYGRHLRADPVSVRHEPPQWERPWAPLRSRRHRDRPSWRPWAACS